MRQRYHIAPGAQALLHSQVTPETDSLADMYQVITASNSGAHKQISHPGSSSGKRPGPGCRKEEKDDSTEMIPTLVSTYGSKALK